MAEHRGRYGKRPPECRQLTYDIAVQDGYAPWRQWLDDQLALLPGAAGDTLAGKVWLDEHFWTVNFELAAGAERVTFGSARRSSAWRPCPSGPGQMTWPGCCWIENQLPFRLPEPCRPAADAAAAAIAVNQAGGGACHARHKHTGAHLRSAWNCARCAVVTG